MLSEYAQYLVACLQDAQNDLLVATYRLEGAREALKLVEVDAKLSLLEDDPKLAQWKAEQKVMQTLASSESCQEVKTAERNARGMYELAKVHVQLALETLKTYRAEQFAKSGLGTL